MGDRLKQSTDQRSFVMIYHDFLRSDKLTANERLIFIYLRMHAGRGNTAFPSLSTLEKETKLSKKTVQRCIESMQEKGVIDVDRRHSTDNGGKISNLYTLHDKADTWNSEVRTLQEQEQEKEDILIKEVARLKAENEYLRSLVETLGKEKEPSPTHAFPSKIDDDSNKNDNCLVKRQHINKLPDRQAQDIGAKKRAKNQFNDFEQRQRSESEFNLLERRLIGQQFSEEENEK